MTATVTDGYVPGAILAYRWGYEQTNVDYYKILKRTNSTVTVVQVDGVSTPSPDNFMVGTSVPLPEKVIGTPIRRKLIQYGGEIRGIKINSYGWCSLWNGQPCNWTAYA
jgi:hypothetical protein